MNKELTFFANELVSRYQNLKIYGELVCTAYSINNVEPVIKKLLLNAKVSDEVIENIHKQYKNREVPFGWYRGKGLPEELEDAVLKIAQEHDINLKTATPEGIREFMKLYGIGVDCSGFVYQVLAYAFEKLGMLDEFINSLSWVDNEKRGVTYAGVSVFVGDASFAVKPSEIKSLDLILIKRNGNYPHIALVIEIDNKLFLTQSNLDSIPSGVTLSEIKIEKNGNPKFTYKPQISTDWNTYMNKGIIEFRRLNILA